MSLRNFQYFKQTMDLIRRVILHIECFGVLSIPFCHVVNLSRILPWSALAYILCHLHSQRIFNEETQLIMKHVFIVIELVFTSQIVHEAQRSKTPLRGVSRQSCRSRFKAHPLDSCRRAKRNQARKGIMFTFQYTVLQYGRGISWKVSRKTVCGLRMIRRSQ